MKTEQQMKNLREALVWWQTVPEANVYPNLGWWTKGDTDATDCGTVACFGGWCARWPGLVAQGLRLSDFGAPRMHNSGNGANACFALFGDEKLFNGRDGYDSDHFFEGSDHALVTNRIRWALEQA